MVTSLKVYSIFVWEGRFAGFKDGALFLGLLSFPDSQYAMKPIPFEWRRIQWIPRLRKNVDGTGQHKIEIPLWIPTALAAIVFVHFHRKVRAHKPGHCRKCEYDLTGNESGVCPDCGTKIA
jgi:hypothetical protein